MSKVDVYEVYQFAGWDQLRRAFKEGHITKKQARVLLARNTPFTSQQITWTIKGWE